MVVVGGGGGGRGCTISGGAAAAGGGCVLCAAATRAVPTTTPTSRTKEAILDARIGSILRTALDARPQRTFTSRDRYGAAPMAPCRRVRAHSTRATQSRARRR